jgi:hypothetical protein
MAVPMRSSSDDLKPCAAPVTMLDLVGTQRKPLQAVIKDSLGRTALLRFTPEPKLSMLPIKLNTSKSNQIEFSPDGRKLIVKDGKVATLYMLAIDKDASVSAPISLGTCDSVAFLGNDGLVSLKDGRLWFRTTESADAWREQAQVEPEMENLRASSDGHYLSVTPLFGRPQKLFKKVAGGLVLAGSDADILGDGRVIALRSSSRLRLYDSGVYDRELVPRHSGYDSLAAFG